MASSPSSVSKKGSSKNIFFIGLISFFGGISQDIFVPILPLYLANVLHLDKSFIGLTEGLVTSSASIFRIISGYLSDRFHKNKPIVFLGYLLSCISRPLLAVVTSGFGILGLRFLDGVGKGMKDAPKDALIADSTIQKSRGRGFGVVRALDTLGSVIGPLLLFVLLYVLRNNTLKYHYIFFITAIPLLFTLGILKLFVREAEVQKSTILDKTTVQLPIQYYIFLGIVLLFSLGNSSDTFLILRAQNVGVSLLSIPLVYALFNFVYAAASIPLGSLSDKIGREKVIFLGWIAYAVSYFGFAQATKPIAVWVLFALYGIYYATTEGVVKAFIADMVPTGHRGKAYGLYNAFVGLITLPASFIAGFLWDKISPAAPFYFSSVISLAAAGGLLIFVNVFKRKL
jgi:MFS family permease